MVRGRLQLRGRPGGLVGRGKPAFAPDDLASLSLWLEGRLEALNDPVDTYPDQSGNDNDLTQGTADNQPALNSSAINGHPAPDFDQSNDYMTGGPSVTQPNTEFWVVRLDNDNGTENRLMDDVSDNATRQAARANLGVPSHPFQIWAGGTKGWQGSISLVVGKAYVLEAVYNGASSKIAVNGVEQTVDIGTQDRSDETMGRDSRGSNNNWGGPIAARLTYDQGVSDSEREDARKYLYRNYGISDDITVPQLRNSDANVFAHQGVATDGTNFWTTESQGEVCTIRRWTRSGSTFTLQSTTDVSSSFPSAATQANHIHYDAANDQLVIGWNNYNTTPRTGGIAIFKASDLSHVENQTLSANWSEGGAYGPNGNWFNCADNTGDIEEYDPSDWSLVTTHSSQIDTSGNTHIYNGLVWKGSVLFANIHDDEGDNQKLDVYDWDGSALSLRQRINPPRGEMGQGIALDPNDSTLWWAARNWDGDTSDHRLVQTELKNV